MAKYSYSVSTRARLLRLKRTQRDLAQALGYSRSYISMVISGRHISEKLRRKIDQRLKQWEEEQC